MTVILINMRSGSLSNGMDDVWPTPGMILRYTDTAVRSGLVGLRPAVIVAMQWRETSFGLESYRM